MRQRLMRVRYNLDLACHNEIGDAPAGRVFTESFPREVLGRRIIHARWRDDAVDVTWLVEE